MQIELMSEFLEEFEETLVIYYENWIINKSPRKEDRFVVGNFIEFALKKAKEDREVPRGPERKSYNDWRENEII